MLKKIFPRLLAIIGLALLVSGIFISRSSASTTKFQVGDTVSVTPHSLTIRSSAGSKSRILGYQRTGAKGVVISGSTYVKGSIWWKVNFNSGVDGWAAEKYLAFVSPAPVVISITPSIVPLPPPTTGTPAPTPTTTPIVQSPIQWGAFVSSGDLAGFEQLVGKQANMQVTFVGWGADFPTSLAAKLKFANKAIVIFWEQYGVTLDAIISGSSDAYIKKFADAAKASGATIILAPLHEMNGNWDPWGGSVGTNTPTKVIAAWRRIHDAFSGSSNVKFAWDVNNVSVPNTSANAIGVYYPGDAYVDYVAVDGFNFNNQSWNQVFPSSLMNQLAAYNKPVYILSTASVPGTQKAQWITDMGTGIKQYPSIAGWVWFNQDGADGNWLVNSDDAALSAFKSILP